VNRTEHTDTVRTSQETHYISATEPNRLMLFGETVAVYCENRTEYTDTLNVENLVLRIFTQMVDVITICFRGLHVAECGPNHTGSNIR
jgi:hypothetical protein